MGCSASVEAKSSIKSNPPPIHNDTEAGTVETDQEEVLGNQKTRKPTLPTVTAPTVAITPQINVSTTPSEQRALVPSESFNSLKPTQLPPIIAPLAPLGPLRPIAAAPPKSPKPYFPLPPTSSSSDVSAEHSSYIILRDIPKQKLIVNGVVMDIKGGFRGLRNVPSGLHRLQLMDYDDTLIPFDVAVLHPQQVVVMIYRDGTMSKDNSHSRGESLDYEQMALSGSMDNSLLPFPAREPAAPALTPKAALSPSTSSSVLLSLSPPLSPLPLTPKQLQQQHQQLQSQQQLRSQQEPYPQTLKAPSTLSPSTEAPPSNKAWGSDEAEQHVAVQTVVAGGMAISVAPVDVSSSVPRSPSTASMDDDKTEKTQEDLDQVEKAYQLYRLTEESDDYIQQLVRNYLIDTEMALYPEYFIKYADMVIRHIKTNRELLSTGAAIYYGYLGKDLQDIGSEQGSERGKTILRLLEESR